MERYRIEVRPGGVDPSGNTGLSRDRFAFADGPGRFLRIWIGATGSNAGCRADPGIGGYFLILERIQLNRSLITLGTGCIEEALKATPPEQYSSCFVVSQQNIWDLHGDRVWRAIGSLSPQPRLRMVPDGEETKNLEVFGELLSWLAESGADRRSLMLVPGGGVVGDLSGFVASSYMRGIDWFYIPTTLLAQQDASVGGKVAVNLPKGKNLVGRFWDPRAVIIDSEVLATLPARQVNAGYMELLKHGMLRGESLFERILEIPGNPDWSEWMPLLSEGLKVKVGIVKEDPFEKDRRRLLNLGHTFAHALESYTGYQLFLHGEGVGLGLIYAALLSRHLGGAYDWSPLFQVVKARVPRFEMRAWDRHALLDRTHADKKGVKGIVPWIIPRKPGKVDIVKGVSRDILVRALDEFWELVR